MAPMAPIVQIISILLISISGSELSTLETRKTLSDEIDELQNVVSLLEDSHYKVYKRLDDILSEIKNLQATIVTDEGHVQLENNRRAGRAADSSRSIGFSASMTAHNENMNLQDTVKFQNLITNDGNGYDNIGGIFRAPISGLYFFNVVILSHAKEDMETEIVKNGEGIVRTYSGDSTTWNAGTQSTVLYLEAGDQVWVRILNAVPSVNNGNIRIFGGGFSSFSGFLV